MSIKSNLNGHLGETYKILIVLNIKAPVLLKNLKAKFKFNQTYQTAYNLRKVINFVEMLNM